MGSLTNYLLVSSLVLMLTIVEKPCLALASSNYQRPLSEWTVGVVNQLTQDQLLSVHCKSKDDDLGDHSLIVNQSFSWKFKENMWSTTQYWCTLTTPKNLHATFDVFWREDHEWLSYRCNFTSCIWIARDDGIYLMNLPQGALELQHNWEH